MAIAGRKMSLQIRAGNKEPEWSSICDNVFDQYLIDDDPFGFAPGQPRDRSSSDDSDNHFDFSGSSEQSHQTDATSPILTAWDPAQSLAPAAQQPKAKAPNDFWHKKLRALEQNAAEHEQRQHKLRAAKSHPDFLSLGGFPSPPAIPQSPTAQSYSCQRQKSRNAANGKKTPTPQRSVTNLRAVSRGRPVGVTKPPASAAAHSHATVRQRNVSPAKMMTPSRYRAGFKDVWAERMESSPTKFQLRVPSNTHSFPASPPPSARSFQEPFAAFGSPIYAPVPGCDERISPLAKTFQQAARLHTPVASPLLSPGSRLAASYIVPPLPLPPNPYNNIANVQGIPLNDTAPLYPERGSSLAANRIQEFDFGFSGSPSLEDPWNVPLTEPISAPYSTTDTFAEPDNFESFENSFNINNARSQDHNLGLGISCDSNIVSGNYVVVPGTELLHNTTFQPPPSVSPFYVPSLPYELPSTPQRSRQRTSGSPTRSPSPPATDVRSRKASTSRRVSRHRRTKSASTTPRHHDRGGGFVNFTPMDSNKILSGVAPSGSSKTKARREKEADDKRRKLSQAAMQAVLEAGGNVEPLQRAGLM